MLFSQYAHARLRNETLIQDLATGRSVTPRVISDYEEPETRAGEGQRNGEEQAQRGRAAPG